MIRDLNHLDQCTVNRTTRNIQTTRLQLRQQVIVDLIAVTMTLNDNVLAVAVMGI